MRRIKLLCVPAAAALTLSVLAGCSSSLKAEAAGSGGSAPSSMSMTIGYTAIGAAYSDLYVCQDQGVFKKNGLDVKLSLINSSSELVAALVSGSVQVGAGVASTTAEGAMNLKSAQLRYVALPISHYYLEMWGKPSLGSVEAVKGLKVGLSSPGSLGDAAVDALLASKGWPKDYFQRVYLKSTPAEVTALESGAVDAIVTQPPTGTQTRTKGFKKIMDFTSLPVAANAYTVEAGYLSSNKAAVTAFVKSEVECLAILHNDKSEAIASIEKHSGVSDPALAEYAYDFFEPLWTKDPTVDPSLVDQAFTVAAAKDGKSKPADTSQYVDDSFVDALQQSGFIDAQYKSK